MNLFSILIKSSGMSIGEVASLLKVSVHTINSWSCGRRLPPEQAIAEVQSVCTEQYKFAKSIYLNWKRSGSKNTLNVQRDCTEDTLKWLVGMLPTRVKIILPSEGVKEQPTKPNTKVRTVLPEVSNISPLKRLLMKQAANR